MKLWMPALGGESLYEEDLPACCARDARAAAHSGDDAFECASCGAMWQRPIPVDAEDDGFSTEQREARRGAA